MLLSLLLIAGSVTASYADSLDAASQSALQDTQKLLSDPASRSAVIQKSELARQADAAARQAAGGDPAQTEQIYRVAGQVFGDLTQQNGGDAAKMQEMLKQAQKDPQGFFNSLSPSQQQAIRDLAAQSKPQPASTR